VYYRDLLKAAVGRLYWPPERALWIDVNWIHLALEGHVELLRGVFGGGKETVNTKVAKDARGNPLVLSPTSFDVTFDTDPVKRRQVRRKLPGKSG
jgi:hypothetical protein